MNDAETLVAEIHELLASDLGESAQLLADLTCPPHLHSPHLPLATRVSVLTAHTAVLTHQSQHRRALALLTDFVSTPQRAQLTGAQLEHIARQIAHARWHLGEHDMCLAQLRQIPRAHRSVADLARMARCAALLHHQEDAAQLYAELLRLQPRATEALAYLGRSPTGNVGGGSGSKVDGAVYHEPAKLAAARAMVSNLQYAGAADVLRRMRVQAPVAALHATCHMMLGNTRRARALYQRARQLDPAGLSEMGLYAELLASAGDRLDVYSLGADLLRIDQTRAAGWVAMARYFLCLGQLQEALALAWKAQGLEPSCADAYSAEGSVQMALGAFDDACEAYLRAHMLGRSAGTFRGLVQAHVRAGRFKEAFVYAKEMAELMPRSAPALAAVGLVLSHSPESTDKAQRLLLAALDIDPACNDAVAALASLHVAAGSVDEAVELVEKYLPHNDSDDMYTRYADLLTLANRLPQAAANYTTALTINPENERARVGFDRVDKLMHPDAADDDDDPNNNDDQENPPEHMEYADELVDEEDDDAL
ncbi:Anaphase promoting complex subunit 7 [Coemansia erecta]|uniref:Anaphase promoting complex subunit 7 n=1 Tax=Coemansia erecta TaxID=147472 RepID=A0A9W7Y1I8_9FUNG|nr:Anaphase promoting complex subunit 7 [Coemansia erecta]